jgi:protein-S-isoprenylcysteine O-methyltransferase Ste14
MTLSFWLIILTVFLYGLVHSLLASLWAKAQARRAFGSQADRWFRLLYNLIAVVTFLPVLILPVILIDKEIYSIPWPWRLINFAGQALAIILLIVGVKQTGIASFAGLRQLFAPEDLEPPRLVTQGLYRYIRHPLYFAGLLFIWLNPVMTWNLLALNIGLTAYIIVGAYFEERKLLREFGDAYRVYKQKTPMLIPFFRTFQDQSNTPPVN